MLIKYIVRLYIYYHFPESPKDALFTELVGLCSECTSDLQFFLSYLVCCIIAMMELKATCVGFSRTLPSQLQRGCIIMLCSLSSHSLDPQGVYLQMYKSKLTYGKPVVF